MSVSLGQLNKDNSKVTFKENKYAIRTARVVSNYQVSYDNPPPNSTAYHVNVLYPILLWVGNTLFPLNACVL